MGLVSASGDLLQGEGAGPEQNLLDGESGALWRWSQLCRPAWALPASPAESAHVVSLQEWARSPNTSHFPTFYQIPAISAEGGLRVALF